MGLLGKNPGQPGFEEIREAVRRKYAEVSQSAAGKFAYPTGREGAVMLGYDPELLEEMPEELIGSFCGVGNPFSLGPIAKAEAVLDVGCGAGFDLVTASRLVGPEGRVCGIDLTPEMASKAEDNIRLMRCENAEVRVAGAEDIPYDDGVFDVVISNGVLNLSPMKEKCCAEIYRVLRKGGRLQFADIVLKEELPEKIAGSLSAWSDWVGGAVPVRDLVETLSTAGFCDVEFVGVTGMATSKFTEGATFRARKA